MEQGDGTNAGSTTVSVSVPKEEKPMWLTAWRDHLANVKAFNSNIDMCDANGDGDYKLVIADHSPLLKIFSGTQKMFEAPLVDVPVGVVSFYADYNEEVRKPLIAVAIGPFVLIYKHLRAFYKFNLQPIDLAKEEVETWQALSTGETSVDDAHQALENLRLTGVSLSTRSVDFLAITDVDKRETFANGVKAQPLSQLSVFTCIAVLMKDREDRNEGLGCLVLGTETGRLMILDKSGAHVHKKIQLPSPPVHIITSGLLDVEYRIIVACRNGTIYIVKSGELLSINIEVEAQVVALARMENQILVATMSNHVHFYNLKGTKLATLHMPAAITNMCPLTQEFVRQSKAVVIALANGEVRVYAGKSLVNKMQVFDTVMGMRVGKYGREDSTLVMVLKSGAVVVNMLPRTARLDANAAPVQGPPAEQDMPLKVPKRTNLYVEMTQREKDFGVDMHRVFQRDLCKLRLQTARAYVKILTDGQGTQSYSAQTSLRLTAHVQGLGPLFKVKFNVQNTGSKALVNVPIVFTYNTELYRIDRPHLLVPSLMPSLVYTYELSVECLDEGGHDSIRAYVCNPKSCVPVIAALVNMPMADFLMNRE
jgi:Bardet-Biedl syndrome 1 protein